jgi:F-type H+-transporting ATPase subunit gamma
MKVVKERMRTVGNIKKITKAMKMVAASKLRKDTLRLEMGVPFCAPVMNFFDRLPADSRPGTKMVVAVTGDKGLCGGVNSSVVKKTRKLVNEYEAAGGNASIFVLGGKGIAGLKRLYQDRFAHTIEGQAAVPTSFMQASAMAERVVNHNPEKVTIVYNHMISAIAFDTREVNGQTLKGVAAIDKMEISKAIDSYSFEPDRVESWPDLHEFYYGCVLFNGLLDGNAAEQSSRMNAMENASKNAGEMLEKLTLKYNRARQAKITTELCEIISGASAL